MTLYYQPPGVEGQRGVGAPELPPAAPGEGVRLDGWRTVQITIDQIAPLTAGTLAVYFATDAGDTASLAEEIALPASPVGRLDVRYTVDALTYCAPRVTALAGYCRITVRLVQEAAS